MSLTLRKKAQEVLDSHNLEGTHCRISEAKYMVLAGPCGQPVVTIPGIAFSKRDPSLKEVDYAAELLDEFICKHKEKIERFIELRVAFKKMDVREQKEEIDGIHLKHNCGYDRNIQASGDWELFYFSDYLSEDNAVIYTMKSGERPFITLEGVMSIAEMSDYTIHVEKLLKAENLLKKYVEYFDAERAMNAAKAEMNSCDI